MHFLFFFFFSRICICSNTNAYTQQAQPSCTFKTLEHKCMHWDSGHTNTRIHFKVFQGAKPHVIQSSLLQLVGPSQSSNYTSCPLLNLWWTPVWGQVKPNQRRQAQDVDLASWDAPRVRVSARSVCSLTGMLCSCCSHLAMPAPLPDTWQPPRKEIENSHKVFIRDRIIQPFSFGLLFFFF